MVDISAWGSLIGSVGFPIALATYLIIYQSKELNNISSEISKCRIVLALILRELEMDAVEEIVGDDSS